MAVETSKVVAYALLEPPQDRVSASIVVAYALLVPADEPSATPRFYAQIIG